MFPRFSRVAVGGLFLGVALGASPALAADAKQIADAIVAAVAASGETQATYEDATANGDDVTITGYTMTKAEGGDTMTIPTIAITGAAPRDKGGFTAARMTFDNGTMTTSDSKITWQTGSLVDATVPSPDEIKAKAKLRPFSKLDIAGINVSGGGLAAPVDIGSLGVAIDVEADGTPRDFALDIATIKVPPEVFSGEPQQQAVLDALGYNGGFVVNVSVAGGYATATDTLTLRNFTIDTADVGKLDISGEFSGVSLSKLISDQSQDIATTAKLDGLTIRFDNAGIVERALDMQAKMMGASRDDVVAQIGGALPFMLNAIGNQPLQDKVAAAGQAFLKEPKSVTISAKPASPVPFGEIMSTGMSAPNTLPDLLVVDVIANN